MARAAATAFAVLVEAGARPAVAVAAGRAFGPAGGAPAGSAQRHGSHLHEDVGSVARPDGRWVAERVKFTRSVIRRFPGASTTSEIEVGASALRGCRSSVPVRRLVGSARSTDFDVCFSVMRMKSLSPARTGGGGVRGMVYPACRPSSSRGDKPIQNGGESAPGPFARRVGPPVRLGSGGRPRECLVAHRDLSLRAPVDRFTVMRKKSLPPGPRVSAAWWVKFTRRVVRTFGRTYPSKMVV